MIQGIIAKIGVANVISFVLAVALGLAGWVIHGMIKDLAVYEQQLVEAKTRQADLEARESRLNELDAKIDELVQVQVEIYQGLRRDLREVLTDDEQAAEWGATPMPDPIVDQLCQRGLIAADRCVRDSGPAPASSPEAQGSRNQ